MGPAEARRISFRFFCTTSTRGKPPSSKRSGIRASCHGSNIGFSGYHKKWVWMGLVDNRIYGAPKLDGLSWFINVYHNFHHERTHFHLDHLRYAMVCPILRQTLTIGRFPVRFAGTWSSVALRPTRHWGITLNASWTGLTVGGNIKGKRWFQTPNIESSHVFPSK